jgi:hypothetical protein
MKKIIGSILFTGVALAAFSQKTINDPNVQKRSASGYHGVSVFGQYRIVFNPG